MDSKSIGLNIKRIREERKISQKKLGELVGKSESAVGNYETGSTDIPCSVLLSMAEVLECGPEEFFGVKHDDFNPLAELRIYTQEDRQAVSGILVKKHKNRVSLLERYGYNGEMARRKCIEYGLYSPTYELSKRGGCWFCPNAKFEEQKEIKTLLPDVWKQFVELESRTDVVYNRFNPFGLSLQEIDEQIEWDSRQMTIFDFI